MNQEAIGVKEVARYCLEKYEGDHVPGDGKIPVEIVIGGDDIPKPVVFVPKEK